MVLGFFTENAYERLLQDINENKEKYMSDEDWLLSYFGDTEYYSQSTVAVKDFTPSEADIRTNEEKSEDDLVNTRMMYEAFKV